MTAMRMFGQTSYGRQFIGAFSEKFFYNLLNSLK